MKLFHYIFALVLAFAAGQAAAEKEAGTGFWAGGDIGVSFLERKLDITGTDQDTRAAFALRGGYAWNPRWLFGLELGGISLEGTSRDDRARGRGINTFYLYTQYYPGAANLFFLKAGAGVAGFWSNHDGETSDNGTGLMLGAGQDISLDNLGSGASGKFYLTPSIDYSYGHYGPVLNPPGIRQNQSYQAVTLRLGVTFR